LSPKKKVQSFPTGKVTYVSPGGLVGATKIPTSLERAMTNPDTRASAPRFDMKCDWTGTRSSINFLRRSRASWKERGFELIERSFGRAQAEFWAYTVGHDFRASNYTEGRHGRQGNQS